MIKTENNVFYMTAGEACCILKNDDGALRRIHFGKRVEFEDDVISLGGASNDVFALGDGAYPISCGGKALNVRFTVDGAEILPEKPNICPSVNGGQTLKISLKGIEASLRAEVYITPYSRGGFATRTVIFNDGEKTVTVKALPTDIMQGDCDIVTIGNRGDIVRESGAACSGESENKKKSAVHGVYGFIAATDSRADECHGDSYGFLCVHGDGTVVAERTIDGVTVYCKDKQGIKIESGGSYYSPEILSVYSDSGLGGMSRVFHDILRENLDGKMLTERRPIVLFCPEIPESKLCDAAVAATKLGCDVFAVDCCKVSHKAMEKLAQECKAAGIKLGVTAKLCEIDKKSAAYSKSGTKQTDDGMFAADFGDPQAASAYIAAFADMVEKYGVEYVLFDIPNGNSVYARGMYALRGELSASFDNITVEFGNLQSDMRYGQTLCYPLIAMRNAVSVNGGEALKTRFDLATLGCLGYAFNPLELGDDFKRAVRAQVFSYQDNASEILFGDIYRPHAAGGDRCIMTVAKDKSKAYIVYERSEKGKAVIKPIGLDEHNIYYVAELNKTFSGAALISRGIAVPPLDNGTFVLHIRQVADFES
ncbi:MAG: alpha-galactosidase [Clostridiales bacterium]|nr:alpha-galactosidase [Clostridiales bacterium]